MQTLPPYCFFLWQVIKYVLTFLPFTLHNLWKLPGVNDAYPLLKLILDNLKIFLGNLKYTCIFLSFLNLGMTPVALLLMWINLIPAWISNYIHYNVCWIYLTIPKLQWLHHWSLGMDKYFHPTLYWACDYLSMMWLQLIYVNKRGQSSPYSYSWKISTHLYCLFNVMDIDKLMTEVAGFQGPWYWTFYFNFIA